MGKTKQQEIQEDIDADRVMEYSREVEEGSMDTWIAENFEDLVAEFIDDYNKEWVEFCRKGWEEHLQ